MSDLAPALEAQLLRELTHAYDWENELHFRARLRRPPLSLSETMSRLGAYGWDPSRIEINRRLVLERPWTQTTEVLRHEMAHQYVREVLGIVDEAPHGPAFRSVCEAAGIDGRAAGLVESGVGDDATSRLVDRVQKLLALASSSEQHEAEAAMRKAHELMLRHNLENHDLRGPGGYEVRHLGDPARRRSRMERDVVGLLLTYFGVQAIEIPVYRPRVGKRGIVFEITGTRANVALAEHVFSFLNATSERLWQEARHAHDLPGTERVPYQSGVIRGFGEKLAEERSVLAGTGLVWVGDADLKRFHRARHPRVHTVTRRSRGGAAHALGRAAGKEVVLHGPLGGASSSKPRLLSPHASRE